jgi:hypothetical protein
VDLEVGVAWGKAYLKADGVARCYD